MTSRSRSKLPIGIQTFRTIREGGYYYVDKTPFAGRLVDERGDLRDRPGARDRKG